MRHKVEEETTLIEGKVFMRMNTQWKGRWDRRLTKESEM